MKNTDTAAKSGKSSFGAMSAGVRGLPNGSKASKKPEAKKHATEFGLTLPNNGKKATEVGPLSGDDEIGTVARQELAVLSPRMREILVLTAKGLDCSEIAPMLGIAKSSAQNTLRSMRLRLQMTTSEAIVLAAKAGWV